MKDTTSWGKRYASAFGLSATGVSEIPEDYVVDNVGKLVSGPGTVLVDLGCGPGRHIPSLLGVLNPNDGLVVAIDCVDVVIGGLVRHYENQPFVGFCLDLNLPLNPLAQYRISGILCTDVLSVVNDPISLLQNVHNVSQPDTVMLLTFQTTDDETMADGEEIDDDLPGTVVKATSDGTRFRFFEELAARQLFEKIGYKILDWKVFRRSEGPHVGREYEHTHVEVGCILTVRK